VPIHPTPQGVRIELHVQPRASRTEIAGMHGDALKLRIASPPIDGAANDEIIRFLAARLALPRRAVIITGGASGRRKVVAVEGVTVAAARLALGLAD